MTEFKPKFGYWNIRGFGQPIRFLLKYLKINYEEITYNCNLDLKFNEWDSVKGKLGLDFPNLPYWIDENVKMTESRAIIQYLARRYDPSLLPQNSVELMKSQMLDGVISDVWTLLVGVTYFNSKETMENYKRDVTEKLKQISNFMQKLGSPWCLGNNISYLDFLLYEILYHNLTYERSLLDNLPHLRNQMEEFEKISTIAQFIKSKDYITEPCFRPWAKVRI